MNMASSKFHIVRLIVVIMAALGVVGCGNNRASESEEYVRVEGFGIGTTYRIIARTSSDRIPEISQAASDIFAEMTASMSIFDSTSLLSRINRGETDSVDMHIKQMISLARGVNSLSEGMYDITVAPLTEAYGFAGKERQAEVSDSGYTIQILASDKQVKTSDSQFKGYRGKVSCYIGGGVLKYKYCYGSFSSRSEASQQLAAVKRSFKDAFVVRYSQGKIVK